MIFIIKYCDIMNHMIRINIIKSVSQGIFENMYWPGDTEYRNEEQESFKDRKKYLTGRKYLSFFI